MSILTEIRRPHVIQRGVLIILKQVKLLQEEADRMELGD